MFLDVLTRRNPALIDAAVELHRRGAIPPATFVIDADQVEANARRLADAAEDHGLQLYFMLKQLGRNPVLAERVTPWIPAAVTVDLDDADVLSSAGVKIGHVGHLVQPHDAALARVLRYEPEVVTLFGAEKARRLSEVAGGMGREQAVLLRVVGPDDRFFPGQEGGIPVAEVASAYEEINSLPGLRVAGVTSFPVFDFDGGEFLATPNLRTLTDVSASLGGLEQVNAPGHTSLAVLPALAAAGATHAEPGHALTGTTPLAAVRDVEEVPAACYLTEVSHLDDARITVFGGGFYSRGNGLGGVVVRGDQRRRLELEPLPDSAIDYYRHLRRDGAAAAVGDPVVFAFRFQAFATRAKVAAVAGVGSADPEVIGLHDVMGRPLGAYG
jgi:predicted amino acid racemase